MQTLLSQNKEHNTHHTPNDSVMCVLIVFDFRIQYSCSCHTCVRRRHAFFSVLINGLICCLNGNLLTLDETGPINLLLNCAALESKIRVKALFGFTNTFKNKSMNALNVCSLCDKKVLD